jgi:hypothetical protein
MIFSKPLRIHDSRIKREVMKFLLHIILLCQVSDPIARDELSMRDDTLALIQIREPTLTYGEHRFATTDVIRFPNVGTVATPVFKISLEERAFPEWNGRTKDLPLSLLKIRKHIIDTVNKKELLRKGEGIWLLGNVVLWTVSEEHNHCVWVASFKYEVKDVGLSYQQQVSLFFHLDGTPIKPSCITGEEREFHDTFGEFVRQ